MNSALYFGRVRHRRHYPRTHSFDYGVFMVLLDLDELNDLFARTPGWSSSRWAPARYRREDFLGDPAIPLDTAVRQRVEAVTGCYPTGPVRMLCNLRYFGFIMNPITCYYCFDEAGEQVEYLVAEVTNTPWEERHSYVLRGDGGDLLNTEFAKTFHVSPFHPMDMQYQWRSNTPGERLHVHMISSRNNEQVFDATLQLSRRPATPRNLVLALLRYPLMTAKVGVGIYWEALRLWLKRIPFFPHPDSMQTSKELI